MKIITSNIILILIPVLLKSNGLNDFQLYSKSLEIVEKLEKYSQFSKLSRYADFENLFLDENTIIYNDIVPSTSYDTKVLVRDYVKSMRDLERIRCSVDFELLEISNINRSSLKKGFLNVYLRKNMLYRFKQESTNISFNNIVEGVDWINSVDLKIKIDFELYLDTIKGKPVSGTILKISDVTKISEGAFNRKILIPYKSPLIFDFLSSPIYNVDSLQINNQNFKFSGKEIKYVIIENDKTNQSIDLNTKNDEYKFIGLTKTKNQHINKIRFRSKFPLAIQYEFNLGTDFTSSFDINKLSITDINFNQKISLSTSIAPVQLKVQNDNFKSLKSFNLGLKFNYTKFDISFENASFFSNNPSAIDIDNTLYSRDHSITNINETMSTTSTNLYLTGNFNFNIAELNNKSIKFLFGTNILVSNFSNYQLSGYANANYTGYYEDLLGLVIGDDEQWEKYNLGNYNLSSPYFDEIKYNFGSKIEISSHFDIPFKISSTRMGAKLGVNYRIDNTNLASGTRDEISTSSEEYNSLLSNMQSLKLNNNYILITAIYLKL